MRTILAIISVTIAALSACAGVKRIGYVSAPNAIASDNSVTLTLTAGVPRSMSARESVKLIPYYVNGCDTVWFPEMGIYTRSGMRYHRRSVTFGPERRESVDVILGKGVTEAPYRATRTVACVYGGYLCIRQELHDCCRRVILAVDTVCRWPETTATDTLPVVVGIDTARAPHVMRRDSVTLHFDYPSGGSDVMPSFGANRTELDILDSLIHRVSADSGNRIISISIDGYASPDDSYLYNMQLSLKRAEGMRKYLAWRYSLPTGVMKATGHGEDWEGLCAALRSGRITHADEALAIISRYGVTEGREKRLMDLRGGDTYREMFAVIFPELRRITVTIDYIAEMPERSGRKEDAP